MGEKAARSALQSAKVKIEEIDMVISAGTSRDQSIPTDAMVYAHLLGMKDVQCLHMEVVCLSFLNAVEAADMYLQRGSHRCILIIASEMSSRVIDHEDRTSAILLGDGAAAAVLERGDDSSKVEASRFRTEARGKNISVATLMAGGLKLMPWDEGFELRNAKFHVNGPLELKLAVKHMPEFFRKLLDAAGCDISEIDHIIPHQVPPRMIGSILRAVGIGSERVHVRSDYGNQAAAAIPVIMSGLIDEGIIRRGQRLLLIGGAAGFSLGGVVLVY